MAAVVEAVTYLVLLAAVADHRLLGGPDRVGLAGLAHGITFLAYLAAVLGERTARRWAAPEVVTMLAAAFVPLGTVVAERRLRPLEPGPAGARPRP